MKRIHQILFYLLLVLLPVQLGYHFWPQWAMVLGRRVDYLSPALYLTDILIILMLLLWFIESFSRITYHVSRIKKNILSRNTFILIIPLLFIAANIWTSISRPVAVWTWMKYGEFFLLGFYIVKTKPEFRNITLALAVAALYSSLLAIAQFLLRHSVGGPLWLLGERTFSEFTPGIARIDMNFSLLTSHFSLFRLRPYATFPHPNVLGGFIAAVLPLALVSMCQSVKVSAERRMRIFLFITVSAGIIALVLTFSRSAWAAGGVAITLAIARIMNYELRITNKIIIIGCIGIIFYSLFMNHYSSDESITTRLALNNSAISIWIQHPWLGVGLGNFLVALPSYMPSRTIYFLQPVHNIYLLILAETGIIGVVFIAAFVIRTWRYQVSRIRYQDEKQKRYQLLIAYSLLIILLLGLVDHYPLTLQQGRLLLTLLVSLSFLRSRF